MIFQDMPYEIGRRGAIGKSITALGSLSVVGGSVSATTSEDAYLVTTRDGPDILQNSFGGKNALLRPSIYTDTRGEFVSVIDLHKVIPDGDRELLEYHLCSSCLSERKLRFGGWQRAPYFAGGGVDMDFNRTVLKPDESQKLSRWIATSFGGGGGNDIHQSQVEKVKAVLKFVTGNLPGWGEIGSADTLLKALASKEYKIKNEYSYVWGDTYTNPEHGEFAPDHWVRFLVVNGPNDSDNISGSVTSAAFGAAEDDQKHHFTVSENVKAASTGSVSTQSVEGSLYTEADRASLKQTKKDLRSLGIDTSDINAVYTRK